MQKTNDHLFYRPPQCDTDECIPFSLVCSSPDGSTEPYEGPESEILW